MVNAVAVGYLVFVERIKDPSSNVLDRLRDAPTELTLIALVITIVLVIGGAALLLGGFAFLTNEAFFSGEPIFVIQAIAVTLGYGVMQVGKGLLAGHRRFAGGTGTLDQCW